MTNRLKHCLVSVCGIIIRLRSVRVPGVQKYLTQYWTGISPIVENYKVLTAGVTEEHRALLVPVTVSTGGILVAGRLHQKA